MLGKRDKMLRAYKQAVALEDANAVGKPSHVYSYNYGLVLVRILDLTRKE